MSSWLNKVCPQVNDFWRGEWAAETIEPPRYLFDHELVIVTKGSCEVTIGRTRFALRSGDYVIIPPNKVHATTAGPGGVHRWCIHFDWNYDRARTKPPIWCYYPERPRPHLIAKTPSWVPKACFIGRFLMTGAVPALLETLLNRWQMQEEMERALCRATLLELLVRVTTKPTPAKKNPHSSHLAYLVKDLIDRNEEHAEGVQSQLASLGFSYAHACRSFGKKFGISPVKYRNVQRLERAKALLQNSRLTVSEVAYAVGFQDVGYFGRKFRQHNGISPNQYR